MLRTEDLNYLLEVLHEIYGNFKHLFLDEIQNIDNWELFVNRCRRQGYNILLTGSNSKLLSKELATHLTGRYIEMELYPFSFREYLKYHRLTYTEEDQYLPSKIGEIKNQLSEYIKTGGFPEPLKYPQMRQRYLRDLYNVIITKDIITRYNIRHSKTLKDLATYLTSNYSCEISYNKVKNILNAKSVHTIENYASYIEEAYLVFQLYPHSYKTKLQLMSPKKIYAIDTGLIDALTAKHFDNICRLLENIVALELFRKRAQNQSELYSYKSKQQQEVDFVIKKGINVVQLIQVCYSLKDEKTKKKRVKRTHKSRQRPEMQKPAYHHMGLRRRRRNKHKQDNLYPAMEMAHGKEINTIIQATLHQSPSQTPHASSITLNAHSLSGAYSSPYIASCRSIQPQHTQKKPATISSISLNDI